MEVLDARDQSENKSIRQKQLRGREASWKRAGVKAASSRTGTGYEAGDMDELAPHNEVLVSVSQVKPGVVPRKSRPLPGEACPTSRESRERSADTAAGNGDGERARVAKPLWRSFVRKCAG